MPILWLQTPSPAPAIAVDDTLDVTSRARTIDVKRQVLIFEGAVRAVYDGETVTAERIEFFLGQDQKRAVATGDVLLIDPDGTVRASSLEFSWNPLHRYAKANSVVARIANAVIRAGRLDLTPNLWTFTDFSFTNDPTRHPLYAVSGKSLTIIPKKVARLSKPAVSLLGHKILTWYGQRFNLDPAATGLRPPVPAFHDGGLGVNWQAGRLIAPSTTLEWHFDAYREELPGSGVQLTHSYLPETEAVRPIAPRSELLQRFAFGYFESILVSSPKAESDFISQKRDAVTAFENNNAAATGRGAVNELFTFPVAGGYELGGSAGSFGYLTDFRVETIREVGEDDNLTRAEAEGSLELPTVWLKPNISIISRADAEGFQSDRSFGWARLSGGVVYQVNKAIRFGAGLMGAVQGGTPDYDIDPLSYENGAMLRADYQLGPRQIGYMVRYDTRQGIFDNEVLITQAMGPLEAYFAYRQYPGSTTLGVTLRLQPLLDVLNRRHFGTP